jgi:hypothetical protein
LLLLLLADLLLRSLLAKVHYSTAAEPQLLQGLSGPAAVKASCHKSGKLPLKQLFSPHTMLALLAELLLLVLLLLVLGLLLTELLPGLQLLLFKLLLLLTVLLLLLPELQLLLA